MEIAIGSDHAGFELKHILIEFIKELGYNYTDFGTNSIDSVDYPDFAYAVSKSVSEGENQFGILICGSGVGVSIVANKVDGIRAANVFNEEMSTLARKHNDANILTLGARFIDIENAKNMLKTFLSTDFEGGRHQLRVNKIHSLTGK